MSSCELQLWVSCYPAMHCPTTNITICAARSCCAWFVDSIVDGRSIHQPPNNRAEHALPSVGTPILHKWMVNLDKDTKGRGSINAWKLCQHRRLHHSARGRVYFANGCWTEVIEHLHHSAWELLWDTCPPQQWSDHTWSQQLSVLCMPSGWMVFGPMICSPPGYVCASRASI